MEWLDKMNNAIDYIEANIIEKIDYIQAANIAFCSLSRFQNMFLFITDITLCLSTIKYSVWLRKSTAPSAPNYYEI